MVQRIVLVGDAGALVKDEQPVITALEQSGLLQQPNTSLIYLGDNIYPLGLPPMSDKSYGSKEQILIWQALVSKLPATQVFFVPGNHDWAKGRSYGAQQVNRQANLIRSLRDSSIRFFPSPGCPGPEVVELSSQVAVVFMDSQWWLQQENRPGSESDCDCQSEDDVALRLQELVYHYRNKLLLFVTHHPFQSYGIHGGYYRFKQHLFPLTDASPNAYLPLPLIGSLYPLVRGGFGNIQDLKHPLYKEMVQRMDTILSTHPNCLRLAGHEHSLQHIEKNGQHYIVSGAGIHQTRVRKGEHALFVDEGLGFGVIEVRSNGKVDLSFYRPGIREPLYHAGLADLPLYVKDTVQQETVLFPDSIVTVPAPYYSAGKFKSRLLGANYRSEWSTPVKVPVLDIGREKGGLVTGQRGGGFQSRSLRLMDSAGREYVIRSIEKYPDKTLPEEFRRTFVKDVVTDGISASYPFAALSVPDFARALGIPYLPPRLVYVPDDPRLGPNRKDFAGHLYLFEPREPEGMKKTYSSSKVIASIEEDNDNLVDQQAVLKARLLDMFLMDFDRHEDQWRWGVRGEKGMKVYFPIPRDRDQVFFTNQGIFPRMFSRDWVQPKFQGFRARARNINTFNFNARFFDRSFLNAVGEKDWRKAVADFLPVITDSLIDQALLRQPKEISSQAAPGIAATLRERRQYFEQEMLDYYRFLSRSVSIAGSDKREWFELVRNADGKLRVRVYPISKSGKKKDAIYDREFDPSVTREVRLYGLAGADHFHLSGDLSAGPLVRIIGGGGRDTVITALEGSGPTKAIAYINKKDSAVVDGDKGLRVKRVGAWFPMDFDRRTFKYNVTAPLVSVAINPDDGLFLGLGFKATRHAFAKEPFSAQHQLRGSYAVATGAYNFNYRLDLVDLIGRLDLRLLANFRAPNNTQNFFGFGNGTQFPNKGSQKIDYYRSRFNIVEGGALLKADPSPSFSLLTGPVFQHYWIDSTDNRGRFITSPESGLDQVSLYRPKTYMGWQFQAVVDNRNNKVIPTRGLYWNTFMRWLGGLNKEAYAFAYGRTDLSCYTSFNAKGNLVIAVRLGGGFNAGTYEFFNAQYLGGHDNLRGFRKFRFAGENQFYNNIDLRLRLADLRGYILPLATGLVLFHDIGRVWYPGESSGIWHRGYGAGLWFAPAGRYVFTVSYALSDDGGLPFLSAGFQF
ncbi:BamA/TamA family outer membrane protein [Flavihumibacter rivuli]|uniref:BamA/TamA family outer membrane protein n=1 Tax=Flavihumibacter rivuli TaxID=2838156 RepID=UPI001BDE89BD|nr:BamA/TamA family outer membrane protein [Flavihumibacter rivuli]ULQ56151.1 BamA/TamA family outer membrane protein [Flavihumibacter rivuli]